MTARHATEDLPIPAPRRALRSEIAAALRTAVNLPLPGLPLLTLVALILAALLADGIAPYDPARADLAASFRPPAWVDGGGTAHLLGTDLFGRDILSRLIHGARISLSVSAVAIAIGGGIGVVLGMLAGFLGGWVEIVVMRAVDVIMSFPLILIAIILAVVFGPSFVNIIIVVSILIWPRIARQIRGETLLIREQDYVLYATAAGVPGWKVMIQHVFPNVVPTLLVVLTLEIGHVILVEASLSFLGAGIPPPQPSWGLMVSEGRGLIATGWWVALFPGLAILLTVLSFNTLGDWLRDRLDPRLRDA